MHVIRLVADFPTRHVMILLRCVHADRVVLGAGALGSTEILLRSAGKLPLSERLGGHYSGNGDSLGAATGITRKVTTFSLVVPDVAHI